MKIYLRCIFFYYNKYCINYNSLNGNIRKKRISIYVHKMSLKLLLFLNAAERNRLIVTLLTL